MQKLLKFAGIISFLSSVGRERLAAVLVEYRKGLAGAVHY
jgi:hypothetical protein